MATTKMHPCWTLVQHSGYGYGGDPGFARGLEIRQVETRAERARVEKAGGVIFDTYVEASKAEDEWPYVDNGGLYPHAQGTFSDKTIDGLRIYVPVREAVA
jgi:hypothetical protein